MCRFNPKGETLEDFVINSLRNQGNLSCICKINDSQLFVYGGLSTHYLSSAIIINTENLKIQKLAKGIESYSAACQYFNGKIFVFGGYSSEGHISKSRYLV